MPDVTRLAFFGGVYSNSRALAAAIATPRRGAPSGMYALGDFGAFGPHPDRVFPILLEAGVEAIQGNYEESLSDDAEDCRCGYTDPRDNHFAQLSYDYTAAKTSPEWKRWMATLPKTRRLDVGGRRVLLVHGSPRKINEFLWESTSPTRFSRSARGRTRRRAGLHAHGAPLAAAACRRAASSSTAARSAAPPTTAARRSGMRG